MLNRVVLMGRLTANPELKTTQAGASVTSVTIAVDRNYVKQGEERQADFINCVAWRQTAEFICRYFNKGSMIAVEGQLQSRTYKAKDGTNRYVVEVVADNVSFTGERRDNNNSGNQQNQRQNTASNQQFRNSGYGQGGHPVPSYEQNPPSYSSGNTNDFAQVPLDDDLPF